jgi:L-asparaginase/Glu-tRNA(Gln) amidotransferase subunit D
MAGLLPRVGLILTGGTIDSVGTDRLDLAWYIEANKRLGDGALLAQLPELKSIARVQEIPFRRLPSQALLDSDWLDLVRKIHSIFEQDQADGIVITHGTNTLEETAYFLNLVLKIEKPVVLVGSMRPSSAISADGYLNVVNAVRVAADAQSVGRGCLVVMNETIFNARDVTKNSTYRVDRTAGVRRKGALLSSACEKAYDANRVRGTNHAVAASGGCRSLVRQCRWSDDRRCGQGRRQRHRQRRNRRRAANPRPG